MGNAAEYIGTAEAARILQMTGAQSGRALWGRETSRSIQIRQKMEDPRRVSETVYK
jgi:hypothetical protein